jgi:F0F1-type ATP synthase, subunit b
MGDNDRLNAPLDDMRVVGPNLLSLARKFADGADDAFIGDGQILSNVALIGAGSQLPELKAFSEAVAAYVGGNGQGLVGYVVALANGLTAYGKAVRAAVDAYEDHEEWSKKQLAEVDRAILRNIGLPLAERQPFGGQFLDKAPPAPVTQAGRIDYSPGAKLPRTKWESVDFVTALGLLIIGDGNAARAVAGAIRKAKGLIAGKQQAFASHVQDLSGWESEAGQRFREAANATVESMRDWANRLDDLANKVDAVGEKMIDVRDEAIRVRDKFYDRVLKREMQYWKDYNEVSGLLESANNEFARVAIYERLNEIIHDYIRDTDQYRSEAEEDLRRLGEDLSETIHANTIWHPYPKTYQGLVSAPDSVPGSGGGVGVPRVGGPRAGGAGGGGVPAPGVGGGGGAAPTPKPYDPRKDPGYRDALRRYREAEKRAREEAERLRKLQDQMRKEEERRRKELEKRIREAQEAVRKANEQAAEAIRKANEEAARAAEAARREAAEAIQRAEQARADAMRAGLDLRSAIPDLQNLGSEFDRLRDGVVPLVPGPGGTSTSPVTPLRPGSSTSASSVVSLGGRTAGVGDVVLTPTAPSPALGGTTAASGAAGTAATEGMVPFMPPMMGGMPAAVGGGGGSGGGGGGPLGGRSIRRGGPRLVDPEEGKGPAALTGRATDKRRESVKPATLETEGWVTEPTSATPVSQPAPRVTRGAVS